MQKLEYYRKSKRTLSSRMENYLRYTVVRERNEGWL